MDVKNKKKHSVISGIAALLCGMFLEVLGLTLLENHTYLGIPLLLCGLALIIRSLMMLNKNNQSKKEGKAEQPTTRPIDTSEPLPSNIISIEDRAQHYCINCGAKLIQGAKFCQSCGAPILVQGPTQHVVETPKDWGAYFMDILQKNFPQFTVKENVPVKELTGDINDVFKLYKERPNQVYKAEWGKPYDFVLYSGNKATAVIMLAATNEHSVKVTYLISKMFAKKLNVPYIGFYTKFNNKEEYVVNRIKSILC